jgi:CheY-like chemotaxis protein
MVPAILIIEDNPLNLELVREILLRVALVVDDDAEAGELATDVLSQRGFEVLQAFGGPRPDEP